MRRLGNRVILAAFAICLVLGGAVWFWYENQKVCCAFPDERETRRLGLMTSLPLYWPLGADIADIASGNAPVPWQRQAMERRFDLVPLDTLSPIPALSPDEPETDPLAELDYLAIIQPRGLSPADNVALDEWVRAGGRLLLVLDPMLRGEYEFPLGDPRRPTDMALVPPVVARWGLRMQQPDTEAASATVMVEGVPFDVEQAGLLSVVDPDSATCRIEADGVIAQCEVEEGMVTLMTDAAVFEKREFAGENGAMLQRIVAYAFD
jgi:hypothetical protein